MMSRKSKVQSGSKGDKKARYFYSLHPWRCDHHADRSEITAYVEASGHWETVAVVPPTSGASAEAVATFIVRLINAAQQNRDILRDAMEALEGVMNDGLNFTTEQTAEHVIISIKKVVT
jgi:hypothetical protein